MISAHRIATVEAELQKLLITPTHNIQNILQKTPQEIQQLTTKLSPRKGPGADGLSTEAIKHDPPEVHHYLFNIFNILITPSYFPTSWKKAHIIMIPKPGKNKTLPTSYRPISLLSHLRKLFEKVLLSRLRLQLDTNQVLPNNQFGFRPGHDTQAQLVKVVDHIAI